MEVPDKVRAEDPASRNPGTFLRAVPLPVYQVLEAASPTTNVKETPDGVHRAAVHHPGRRRGKDRGGQIALHDWLNLGHMEGGVDAHRCGKFQADCTRVDDPVDDEGPNEARSEFPGLHL